MVLTPEVRAACQVVLDWCLEGMGPGNLLVGQRPAMRERLRLVVVSVLHHFLDDWGE